jgi:hypothetical protein
MIQGTASNPVFKPGVKDMVAARLKDRAAPGSSAKKAVGSLLRRITNNPRSPVRALAAVQCLAVWSSGFVEKFNFALLLTLHGPRNRP